MVQVELTPLDSVLVGVRIVGHARPFDNISHTLHDGHNLNGLDIEVVLRDMSTVYCNRLDIEVVLRDIGAVYLRG